MRSDPRLPSDVFSLNGKPTGFTVGDFWQWGMSDLAINTIRSAVAEFIVSKALGCKAAVRDCWGGCDLVTPEAVKIEVKSAAYWQAWKQEKASEIRFAIAPARDWCAETNTYSPEIKRNADVYVFCLINNEHNPAADLMELSHWEFFVLPASWLNESCLKQKTISLKSLMRLKPERVEFLMLKESVFRMANSGTP